MNKVNIIFGILLLSLGLSIGLVLGALNIGYVPLLVIGLMLLSYFLSITFMGLGLFLIVYGLSKYE